MDSVLTHEHNEYALPHGAFYMQVDERGYGHTRNDSWATDKTLGDYANLMDISYSSRIMGANGEGYIAFDYDSGMVCIYIGNGAVQVNTAAPTVEDSERILEAMRELIPKAKPTEPDVVSINFWALGGQGPANMRRNIHVPSWEEIVGNYPTSLTDSLGELMVLKNGVHFENGQLVLWQGLPGTGKTYALRALARNWREWCEFHYITDPERFFGGNSDYMLQVILGNAQNQYIDLDDPDDGPKAKWNLLILEDSGELLAADAKAQTGQGLSRLLNVVDGLIGQGLRIIVLVTTNEELKALHPAVIRHGRCSARLEFDSFNKEEAEEWLKGRGIDSDVSSGKTLAELFALEAGKREENVPVGFH